MAFVLTRPFNPPWMPLLVLVNRERSDRPEEEIQHAITLLRQCYERYATRAQNRVPSLAERVGAALHQDRALQARFRAAFIAISMASLYQMIENEQQRECWKQVGSDDFYATYRSGAIVQQAIDLAKMGGRSGQYGFYRIVRLEKTQAAALEALRRKFERRRDSIAGLRPLAENNPRLDLEAHMVSAPMKLPMDPWDLLKRDRQDANAK